MNPNVLKHAVASQRRASDPSVHVGVTANAGSGKTRVLVDRVIRLLLTGAEPGRILCLTFTKAAAAEMQSRLFARLGAWATMDDEALGDELEGLAPEGAAPNLAEARALFARSLETPGGLKIQTIHGFCERLLRRFPLEAGVPAAFEIMDEPAQARAAAKARTYAAVDPDAGEAFARLAAVIDDGGLEEFLNWASNERVAIARQLERAGGLGEAIAHMREGLGLAPSDTLETVQTSIWAETPQDDLRAAAAAFAEGGKIDQKHGSMIAEALNEAEPRDAFHAYTEFVFTKEGQGDPRVNFVTKGLAERHPLLAALYGGKSVGGHGREVARMVEARERLRAVMVAELTEAGLTVAAAYVEGYAREKTARGALDFTDLIDAAARLLTRADAADWVRFKLDGGVDHILVDEAQDTSPDQWEVVKAFAEEFLAGAGAERDDGVRRTVFAVGDEKQSIYGFQGAAPEEFSGFRQWMSKHAPEHAVMPTLETSFRSTAAVLNAVDAVFALHQVRETMAAGTSADDPPRPPIELPAHKAAREDAPGCVDVWPIVPKPEAREEPDAWSPVDAPASDHPRETLARLIAEETKRLIGGGLGVSERGVVRPAEAGDVLILVRKRGPFFQSLIRRLKAVGVPVAGADRMTLADELSVQDLLGAARAALSPHDDLAVAEFLKSPFAHRAGAPAPLIDEEALFDLCHPRKGRLIDALAETNDPRFADMRDLLADLINRARTESPHAFIAGLLERPSPTGEVWGRRLFARLGVEAEDAVDELITRAIAHERAGAPSLARFVHEVLSDKGQVKRELSEAKGAVRVMTVHGSKGLEAPVVIVPDIGGAGVTRSGAPVRDEAGGWWWSPRKGDDPVPVARRRERQAAKDAAEDLRLLYVALTRAADHLIVCGAESGRGGSEGGWLDLVTTGVSATGDAQPIMTPLGEGGLRLGAPTAPAGAPTPDPKCDAAPAWLSAPAPEAEAGSIAIAPTSGGIGDDEAALSPLAEGGPKRFHRGVMIHALLQRLPDIAPDERRRVARAFIGAQSEASEAEAEAWIKEALAVMEHPEIAPVFGSDSRAEVAIAGAGPGLAEGIVVNGRVDRLSVSADTVTIVDFKTNRPPPEDVADVPMEYLRQMATYRAVLRAAYPDHDVRCALVWTDGPRVAPLPNALLDASLASG